MNILFGKRKSAKEKVIQNKSLPTAFAQEVLDLEEQLNMNCTLAAVTRLMELYTKAIEFYEAEKNLKHIHYQERMQNLLSRTNVVQLFKNSESNVKSAKVVKGFLRTPVVNESLPVSPRSKLEINTELKLGRNCEKVIKQHTVSNINLSQKIQDNLKSQSDSLSLRLYERKLLSPKNKANSMNIDEINQCDVSAGESKNNPVEEFEKEVEKILEKYLKEKIKAKKEIKDKYQESFDEISKMKGDVKEQLMQELTKSMNNEIMEWVSDSDARRNQEISVARQKLNMKSFRF